MQGSSNSSSSNDIFRFSAFSIEVISYFTHRDAVQLSGSFSENGARRNMTFQMDYPTLNLFLRSRLSNQKCAAVMSSIGEGLSCANPRWESILLADVIGAPMLLQKIGLLVQSKQMRGTSPFISKIFNLKE